MGDYSLGSGDEKATSQKEWALLSWGLYGAIFLRRAFRPCHSLAVAPSLHLYLFLSPGLSPEFLRLPLSLCLDPTPIPGYSFP